MGNDFRTKVQQIIDQITDILEKRNEKYGDLNLMESGLLGIIIRIKDKIARIKKLFWNMKRYTTNLMKLHQLMIEQLFLTEKKKSIM